MQQQRPRGSRGHPSGGPRPDMPASVGADPTLESAHAPRSPEALVITTVLDFVSAREHSRGRGRRRGPSRLPAKQGAGCGTRSQDPEIMTSVEGRRFTNGAPGTPSVSVLGFSTRGPVYKQPAYVFRNRSRCLCWMRSPRRSDSSALQMCLRLRFPAMFPPAAAASLCFSLYSCQVLPDAFPSAVWYLRVPDGPPGPAVRGLTFVHRRTPSLHPQTWQSLRPFSSVWILSTVFSVPSAEARGCAPGPAAGDPQPQRSRLHHKGHTAQTPLELSRSSVRPVGTRADSPRCTSRWPGPAPQSSSLGMRPPDTSRVPLGDHDPWGGWYVLAIPPAGPSGACRVVSPEHRTGAPQLEACQRVRVCTHAGGPRTSWLRIPPDLV
ncbi:protein CLN8 isoform X4 [Mustela putorius furo]|nr:protein CLN8 isoform X4 [Mustela putorius furo]XP_044942125.1 protein CLN8 isoform X4 [Mustela putorius furo]XP_044942126.1 protein CLN8 isoform X4 [Mustela putorius furo]